jgi:protein-S-isoprenylcysteine O-methyltransferase Ste14
MRTLLDALELKVPPVLLAAGCGVAMWGIARAAPGLRVNVPGRTAVAAVLVALGAAVAIAGVVGFRAQRTTVNPTRPAAATSLVQGGVYRWTRNPMYLGLALGLAGAAVGLSNLGAMVLLPAFVTWIDRLQIVPEERALLANFGAAFTDYAARVRRWL